MADSSIKRQTISGIIWASIQKFGTMGISLVSNIILARLLSPDDYGSIGLLAVFIAISEVFVSGGFTSAIIQKKNPSEKDYSTVFIWNIFISIFFYIILYICAPYIALFYKISLITSLLRVQGLIIFIHAFGIIQFNILRKRLEFKIISTIQIVAALIAVIVAIFMAYNGFGVWSLVIQQLLNALITTLLLWILSPSKIHLKFSITSFKELFSYGSFLLLSDLLNSFCDNIQALIIGRKYTSSDMGYYTQAKKLETVPTQSISYVVSFVTFPVYSKLQDNKKQLYNAVRKSLLSMNFLNIPLMILLIVIAKPLFIILFSNTWIDSVPYFQILCISGLVNCLQSVNYQVVCAVGRSKDILKWNIVKRIIGIIFILVGMNWGIKGILWGIVFSTYFTYVVNAIVAMPTTNYSILKQIKDAIPILFISVTSALIVYSFSFINNIDNFALLLLQSSTYITIYLLMAKFTKRIELIEFINIIEQHIKR